MIILVADTLKVSMRIDIFMMTDVEVKNNMNKQLKPCPFCGGKAHIRKVTENAGCVHYETVCVLCKDCGAQSVRKISDWYYGCYCSDEEIAELWNRRI